MLAIKEDNCVCLVFFFVQELNNRLDDVTQENSNLLSKVSSLEESISLADQERTILQDKMNALTEGKDEVEKKLGLMMESLETEKQVCCVGSAKSTEMGVVEKALSFVREHLLQMYQSYCLVSKREGLGTSL